MRDEVIITDQEARKMGLCRHDVRHVAVRRLKVLLWGRDYLDGPIRTRYDRERKCVVAYIDYHAPYDGGVIMPLRRE